MSYTIRFSGDEDRKRFLKDNHFEYAGNQVWPDYYKAEKHPAARGGTLCIRFAERKFDNGPHVAELFMQDPPTEPLSRFPVQAVWFDCVHGVATIKTVELELVEKEADDVQPQRRVVQVHGGPTGYESFQLRDDEENWNAETIENMCANGWWACAGTHGRWPALYINGICLRQGFQALGLADEKGKYVSPGYVPDS